MYLRITADQEPVIGSGDTQNSLSSSRAILLSLVQIIDIIRFITIGWIILIVIQLIRATMANAHKIPATVFAISCMSYLVVDWFNTPLQWYAYPFLVFAMTLPYTFWIFSKSIFEDRFAIRPWMIWGWLLVAAIDLFLYSVYTGKFYTGNSLATDLVQIFQQGLSLVFVILAITAAASRQKDDLIVARLQFRSTFIWCSAILIMLTLLSEISFQFEVTPKWLDLVQKLVIAMLTFWFAARRMQFREGFYLKPLHTMPKPDNSSHNDPILWHLQDIMGEQEAWKTEGLTIRQLADMLNVREYKLRKTINQHLGFSNFNEYLNHYRIAYAKDCLVDPDHPETTVLEIAYASGFQSLSPFNKAFRQMTGMTPTEWRKSRTKKS